MEIAENIDIIGYEWLGEEDGSVMMAAEDSWRGLAVEHGYRVYILPNPKGIRTADFIFERKGVYKMFDLKSIIGKSSVSNRLMESIGQTNHVLLNMMTDYNARLLAKDIQMYFEANKDAREVLIMKGNKFLSVSRRFVEGRSYIKMFMKRYLR